MTIKELGELLINHPDSEKYSIKCFAFDKFYYDHGAVRGDEVGVILNDINGDNICRFDREHLEYMLLIKLEDEIDNKTEE